MTNCEIPWTSNSLNVKIGRCLRGRIIHWLPFTSEMTHQGYQSVQIVKKKLKEQKKLEAKWDGEATQGLSKADSCDFPEG